MFSPPTVYISAASCSGTKDDTNRTIKSPGYPSHYSNHENCTWKLVSSHRIGLTFASFVTESCCDFLYVYDGDSTSSPQILKWSGGKTGREVNSTGQHLFLKFTTDYSVTYTGFTINFEGKKMCKLLDFTSMSIWRFCGAGGGGRRIERLEGETVTSKSGCDSLREVLHCSLRALIGSNSGVSDWWSLIWGTLPDDNL